MEVCSQLGVREADVPGKYLGIPMQIGRNKVSVFNFLAERIEQKLQGWNNHTISKAGKVTLLKTTAQTIPNFWMIVIGSFYIKYRYQFVIKQILGVGFWKIMVCSW